jgi:hypothetical protein
VRLIPLLLLGACGEFGLTQLGGGAVVADTGASARDGDGAPAGQGASEDDDEGGASPIGASLEGRTWAVDLDTVTFTEPAGLEGLLSLLDSSILLFHVTEESEDRLELVVAMAGVDGRQDPCERIVTLPDAAWTNPDFAIDEGRLELTVGGEAMNIRDAFLAAQVVSQGEGWSDGELLGELDAREVEPALPSGTDVCDLIDTMGGSCHACSDGSRTCFDLVIEEIVASAVDSGFDPEPDDSGC